MRNASARLDVALPLHTEHFGEVTLASAVKSVHHLTREGFGLVVVGARYNAVVNVRCNKDSVTVRLGETLRKIDAYDYTMK
jgi:hypothetical protein